LEIEELLSRDQFVRMTGIYLDSFSEIDFQNAGTEFIKAQNENDIAKANKFKKILFFKTDKKHEETTSKLMRKVDFLNIARLIEITKEHGWQERASLIL
jgi:hypothetical protein